MPSSTAGEAGIDAACRNQDLVAEYNTNLYIEAKGQGNPYPGAVWSRPTKEYKTCSGKSLPGPSKGAKP